MNTVTTTNTIEPSNTDEGLEYEPDGWKRFTRAFLEGRTGSLLHTAVVQNPISDETDCRKTDECTYETDETYEIDETEEAEERQEPEELEEREELATLDPTIWGRINTAISECRVSANRDINRPLFTLAHEIRTHPGGTKRSLFSGCNCRGRLSVEGRKQRLFRERSRLPRGIFR